MLTNEMRQWLGNIQAEEYLYDIVASFMREFDLDSVQAGSLIKQWIVEVV